MPQSSTPRIAAVEKAIRILRAFGPDVVELSIRQIVERTDVPRSTVHSMCATLCDAALLEALPRARYQLGPALVELGGQVVARTGMVAAAERVLPLLADATGGEAHLGQLVGGWIVYSGRVGAGQAIPTRNRLGLRAPAHLSGCGKAALAHLDPDEARSLVRAACDTERRPLPDFGQLECQLRRCRHEGFVLSSGFQAERASVAAPIFDGIGNVIGGISVAGPVTVFIPTIVPRIAEHVVSAAEVVSRRLGYAGRSQTRRPAPGWR